MTKGQSKAAKLRYGQPTFESKHDTAARAFGAAARHKHLHGNSNPFSVEADGSKIPDGNTSKTVALQVKQTISMSSDASGKLYHQFQANLMDMHMYALTFSGAAVATWSASEDSDYVTALNTQYSRYRVVSWGIRIFTVLSPTEQSGSIVCQSADELHANPDYTSYLFEEVKSFATDDLEVVFIGKETDARRRQYRLIDAAGTAAAARDVGMNILYVGGSGLPASKQCFTAEIVMNIECQPLSLTTGSLLATPAAHHDPIGLAAVANTHASIPSFFKSGLAKVGKHVAMTLGSRLMDLAEVRLPPRYGAGLRTSRALLGYPLRTGGGGGGFPSLMNVREVN